jgi:hypothetical protein
LIGRERRAAGGERALREESTDRLWPGFPDEHPITPDPITPDEFLKTPVKPWTQSVDHTLIFMVKILSYLF